MSNVNTLQSSEQDNALDIGFTSDLIVSVAKKKPCEFRNKMYYIFGEYKVQDSELTPLYHVGGIIADIKLCRFYV